jgi:FkbM family methyltransferase
MLQQLSSRISQHIGRDHALIRFCRPAYEHLLDHRGGFLRTINGRDSFLIDPHHRGLFPETYEPAVCNFLRANVRPGDVCLDIGAHVGIYALCLARWSSPRGRVFAFEPNPAARAVLESNLARNAEGKRVTVIPQGISDHAGDATFYAAGLEGFSRLGSPNRERREMHHSFTVPLTTIDDFCARRQLQPNWILIDIEGYEVAALRGAVRTLAHPKTRLIVEMHPFLWAYAGTSRTVFKRLLEELHLRPVALSGQKDVWSENGQVVLEEN